MDILYRNSEQADVLKLSILYKTVYIQTYGSEGVSDEFANFITKQFSTERLSEIIAESPERIIVADYKNNLLGVWLRWNGISNVLLVILLLRS